VSTLLFFYCSMYPFIGDSENCNDGIAIKELMKTDIYEYINIGSSPLGGATLYGCSQGRHGWIDLMTKNRAIILFLTVNFTTSQEVFIRTPFIFKRVFVIPFNLLFPWTYFNLTAHASGGSQSDMSVSCAVTASGRVTEISALAQPGRLQAFSALLQNWTQILV
jgi:hypothetical protein